MSAPGNDWLRVTNVSKHFGAVVALEKLDAVIRLGEVVALVGEAGRCGGM